MSCPRCARQDVGQISFGVVASGVTFHFCRYCEHRWWVRSAERMALAEVLEAATVLARTG